MLLSGCGDEKKDFEDSKISYTQFAVQHKKSEQEMPNFCPKEHRIFLEELGIAVPIDKNIHFDKKGKKNSIIERYTFEYPKYAQITVELYTDDENIGKIKSVDGVHMENNRGSYFYIVKDGKVLGKIDECHAKYLAEINGTKQNYGNNKAVSKTLSDEKFMADFNTVMSNQYNGLYAGSQLSIGSVTAGSIRIFVTPVWYSLNEGQKNAFVMQTAKWYFGMMGARGMSYNMDQIDLFFRDSNTDKQVAKWGSIRGAVINN